jgi:hypothetical protein
MTGCVKRDLLRSSSIAALVLYLTVLVTLAAVRILIQQRRTGDSGNRLAAATIGSPQWWSVLIAAVGVAAVGLAPVADLAGLPGVGYLDHPIVKIIGSVLVVGGASASLMAELAMGDSWRMCGFGRENCSRGPWSFSLGSQSDLHGRSHRFGRPGPDGSQCPGGSRPGNLTGRLRASGARRGRALPHPRPRNRLSEVCLKNRALHSRPWPSARQSTRTKAAGET